MIFYSPKFVFLRQDQQSFVEKHFARDEALLWSSLRDPDSIKTDIAPSSWMRTYAEAFCHFLLICVGIYGVIFTQADIAATGLSFPLFGGLILYSGLAVFMVWKVYVELRDFHFPHIPQRPFQYPFVISNLRLLRFDPRGKIVNELPVSDISGFIDIPAEDTTEWDEDQEEVDDSTIFVTRRSETDPFANGFIINGLIDREAVMTLIARLAKIEILP